MEEKEGWLKSQEDTADVACNVVFPNFDSYVDKFSNRESWSSSLKSGPPPLVSFIFCVDLTLDLNAFPVARPNLPYVRHHVTYQYDTIVVAMGHRMWKMFNLGKFSYCGNVLSQFQARLEQQFPHVKISRIRHQDNDSEVIFYLELLKEEKLNGWFS